MGEEQQLWMQNEDKELRMLAGWWCRLGYRLAAVLVQASIFFQRCPLVGDLREICLVSGRCVFGGTSNLPEPGSLTGAGKVRDSQLRAKRERG